MEIEKAVIKGSPYIGVFAMVSEKFGLFPKTASENEVKAMEKTLGIEGIQTNLANSSLIGVLAVGNSNGIIVPEIVEDHEVKELKEKGVEVKKVKGIAALGNLIEANDSKGICSKAIPKEIKKEIAEFLGIELVEGEIAGTDLIGSCLVATNKGFVVHPQTSEKEFENVGKFLGTEGSKATANYGDVFIGNSVIANSKAAIVGMQTTGHEILRIDEGLRGE